MRSHLADLPDWIAFAAAFFVVLGATLALIGAWGLARLQTFYERLHAPTLGTSWGTAGVALAAILVFSAIEGRYVIHALVVSSFVMITTPVTLLVVGRAAYMRDRAEGNDVPAPPGYVVEDPPEATLVEDPAPAPVPAPPPAAPPAEAAPEPKAAPEPAPPKPARKPRPAPVEEDNGEFPV